MRAQYTPAEIARFWAKVDRTGDGCWEWTAGRYRNGYGQFGVGTFVAQVKVYAHRMAYELMVGPIPAGMCVCHACDNRICCRVDHLWLGTYADNNRDSLRKGRKPHGESASFSILTEAQVRAIRTRRAAGEKGRALAAEYGVSGATICNVYRGKTWRHVQATSHAAV